jgi:hypothetical protein
VSRQDALAGKQRGHSRIGHALFALLPETGYLLRPASQVKGRVRFDETEAETFELVEGGINPAVEGELGGGRGGKGRGKTEKRPDQRDDSDPFHRFDSHLKTCKISGMANLS